MKMKWTLLLGAALPLLASEIPHEIGDQYPAIILKDGTTLSNVEIVAVEYVIRHDGGLTRVPVGGFRPGKLPPVGEFFSEKMLQDEETILQETPPEQPDRPLQSPRESFPEGEGIWGDLNWGDASFEVYSALRGMDSVRRIEGGALQLRAETHYQNSIFYLYPDIQSNGLYRIRIRGQYYDNFGDFNPLLSEWTILKNMLNGQFGEPLVDRPFDEVLNNLETGVNETQFWETSWETIRLSLNQVEDRIYAIVHIRKAE